MAEDILLSTETEPWNAVTSVWNCKDSTPEMLTTKDNETKLTRVEPFYSMLEVSKHCLGDDCWLVLGNGVYDVTDFLKEHPGGEDIIMEHAGRDATIPFTDVAHSELAYQALEKYRIGILVESERITDNTINRCDNVH